MIAPARRVALDALVERVGAAPTCPTSLARTRDELTDERDRALAAAIVIGTLRWRARLDFHLQQAASRRLDTLDAVVLEILRAEPVPAAVPRTRAGRRRGRRRGVAGAARRARPAPAGSSTACCGRSRDRAASLDLPVAPASIETAGDRERGHRRAARRGSHPRWLVARWIDRLGLDAAAAWVHFNNVEAPLTLRVNRRRATRETMAERLRELGVETAPTRFAPDGLTVIAGNPLRTPLAASGDFLMQDEASQLVPLLVGARPGHRVLDACAAPGGKSLALADALGGDGLLVAADARERRVGAPAPACSTRTRRRARIVAHDLRDRRAVSGRSSIACWSTRRAPASARCGATSTSGGGGPKTTSAVAAARQQRLLADAAQAVATRRAARLRHLLQRARGERGGRRGVSRDPIPTSAASRASGLIADGVPEALLDPAPAICSTRPDRARTRVLLRGGA